VFHLNRERNDHTPRLAQFEAAPAADQITMVANGGMLVPESRAAIREIYIPQIGGTKQ
jgi:hypothetical protein